MKHRLLKTALYTSLFAAATTAQAQMLQTFIGSTSGRNELVTSVKAMPDGSSVLGGYIYDIVSNTPVNIDMLLLRVKADGTILWQKQIGTSNDDLMNNVLVTANGDIVAVGTVGRTGPYSDNTAAILRFDSTGTLLWQKFVRVNPAAGQPGEVLWNVAELTNGNLIGVGGSYFTPSADKSMICSFTSSGTLNYIETRDRSSSDDFTDVTAIGNDVIITGWWDGASYKDARVMRYTPGTTSGTVVWDKSWDASGVVDAFGNTMTCNGLHKVYVRGGSVMASASSAISFGMVPSMQGAFQCDLATGNNAKLRSLMNGKYKYANNTAFYPLDSTTIYVAQNPANTFQDAVLWTAPSFTNGLISKIRPFNTTGQVLAAREYNLPSSQSIFSMDYYGGALLMAGCSNNGTSAVNNDIYFVVSMSSLTNPNKTCDLVDDSLWVGAPTPVAKTPSETIAYPTSTGTKTLTFTNPGLVSTKACGEEVILSRPTSVPGTLLAHNAFTLYPNPATNELTLELKGQNTGTAQLQIMNASGQLVSATTATFDALGRSKLNIAQLAPGNYFFRLSSNEGLIGTRMIVIAR